MRSKPLIIVYFGMFVTQFANMVHPMLTLLLQDKLSMSATEISYALAINFVALAVASVVGGKLADRYNKKHVIIAFDAASVGLYLIGGLTPFSYFTIALIILAGTCQQLELASYSMLVNDLSEDDMKDKAFSSLYMSINVGAFLSASVSGFLILNHTSLVFLLDAAGIFLSAVLIGAFLSYTPPVLKDLDPSEKKAGISEILSVFRMQPLVLYLLMVALASAVHDEYAYIIPLELNRAFSADSSKIYGTMISASCLVVILFTKPVAEILHKYFHTVKMRLSNISQGCGYLILFIGFITRNLPLLYAGFTVYIFGEIIDSLYYEAYMVSKVPAEYCGQIFGLFSAVTKASSMGADIATGVLYDRKPEAGWMFIFLLAITSLLLAKAIHLKEGSQVRA